MEESHLTPHSIKADKYTYKYFSRYLIMRTIVILSLVALTAAEYNYFAHRGLTGNVVTNDVSGETSKEDFSGPASFKEFDKEFFSFSAPEGEFDNYYAAQNVGNNVKKNLRVIFIKGPENSGLENAALQLAKNSAEDRTAIYVLNKQTDFGELANKLTAINIHKNNKPEVHFVKYRTQTDAVNAQNAIQSQYDSLPGTSSRLVSGAAPVLDFVSKASDQLAAQISNVHSNSYIPPNTSYLPPSGRV